MIIGFRSASERWSDDVYAHSPPLQHHVRFPLGTIAAGGSFLLDVTRNKPRLLNNINSCILWTLLCKQWLGMFSNEEPVTCVSHTDTRYSTNYSKLEAFGIQTLIIEEFLIFRLKLAPVVVVGGIRPHTSSRLCADTFVRDNPHSYCCHRWLVMSNSSLHPTCER